MLQGSTGLGLELWRQPPGQALLCPLSCSGPEHTHQDTRAAAPGPPQRWEPVSLRGGRRSWGPGVCPALTLANGPLGQLSTPTQLQRSLRPSRAGPGLDTEQTQHGGQCRPSSHSSPPTYVTSSSSVGGLRGLRGAGGQLELPQPHWGSDPRRGEGAGRRWHLTPVLQEPSARSQPRDPPTLPRATPQEAWLPLPASPERRGQGRGWARRCR